MFALYLHKMFLYLSLMIYILAVSKAARVSDKIYDNIQGDMACFKRFNGTHEVGCTSDYGGNVGVLYIPDNKTDFEWALKEGPHPPYIFALMPHLPIRNILMAAKGSKNCKGFVILHSDNYSMPSSFSPASTCPSHEYGIYNMSSGSKFSESCAADPWNELGNSLLYESFDFPVFLIKDSASIKSISDCYLSHNKDVSGDINWPLCALELHSNMFGTTNTEVCLRRTLGNVLGNTNYCDPIHDYNIIGSLTPMTEELGDSSVIVIAARADAASIFDNISPGADSAITGVVTLLAVANALNHPEIKTAIQEAQKHVLFVLFEGETWDYLGSSSVTYDMSLGQFPFAFKENQTDRISVLNFSNIDHFIELSQVGIQSDVTTKLFVHMDPISDGDSAINSKNIILLDALSLAAENVVDIDQSNIGNPLPPASMHNFLKYTNISGAVLADHGAKYSNQFYQGVLDNEKNINFLGSINGTDNDDKLHIHLGKIASTVASTVYNLATETKKSITADENLIGELLVCYLKNVNCTLFREHSGRFLQYSGTVPYFQPEGAKMYTSVRGGEEILSNITLYLLADFLGEEIDGNEHDCWSKNTEAEQKFFMPTMGYNGTCFSSTARKLSADSPAFRIANYDFSSGEYPTWTESGWSLTSARLFLKPSPAEEIGLVVGGVIFVIVSSVLSYWAQARANVLFVRTPMPAEC